MKRRSKLRLIYQLYVPHLNWCDQCNLPILFKSRCGLCRSEVREVKLTPPGDVRPAFRGDIKRLREACSKFFGIKACQKLFPNDKLVLINKVGGRDRAEEVIVDGVRMGLLYYNVDLSQWRFKPSLEAARRLALWGGRSWVRVDDAASSEVSKGRNVLAPGVVDIDTTIKAGDEVFVVDSSGQAIAVGIARVDAKELPNRGIIVKVRESGEPKPPKLLKGGQKWEDAVKANMDVIRSFELKAIGFIKQHVRRLPAAVSFSGGKDSMALFLLALKALGKEDIRVLFIDTGIEYPETIEYVKRVETRYGVKIYTYGAGDGFWRGLKIFGPPARNYRWCCKVCKMAPTKKAIEELFGGAADVLIGLRRIESGDRMRRGSIWQSRWIVGERGISAIYDWPTLLVWLYLFREGAPINPLYEMGFDRIGCWPCPSADLADFEGTKQSHPELWEKWIGILERWAQLLNMNEEWVKRGDWRIAKNDPRKGWLKVKGEALYITELVPLKKAFNILNTTGIPSQVDTGIVVEKDGDIITLTWKNGLIEVKGGSGRNRLRVAKTLGRILFCVECHLCEYTCPTNSAKIEDGEPTIDPEKCTHCTLCNQVCPIYIYLTPTKYITTKA